MGAYIFGLGNYQAGRLCRNRYDVEYIILEIYSNGTAKLEFLATGGIQVANKADIVNGYVVDVSAPVEKGIGILGSQPPRGYKTSKEFKEWKRLLGINVGVTVEADSDIRNFAKFSDWLSKEGGLPEGYLVVAVGIRPTIKDLIIAPRELALLCDVAVMPNNTTGFPGVSCIKNRPGFCSVLFEALNTSAKITVEDSPRSAFWIWRMWKERYARALASYLYSEGKLEQKYLDIVLERYTISYVTDPSHEEEFKTFERRNKKADWLDDVVRNASWYYGQK